MASFPGTHADREYQNFKSGPNGESLRQVTDEQAQSILSSILSALGGAVTTSPNIFNLSLPLANTEYSQSITNGAVKVTLRTRLISNLKLGFAVGESSTKFITIPGGSSYEIDMIKTNNLTLYVQSDRAGNVLEVVEWV
jgi:hypothetical protein